VRLSDQVELGPGETWRRAKESYMIRLTSSHGGLPDRGGAVVIDCCPDAPEGSRGLGTRGCGAKGNEMMYINDVMGTEDSTAAENTFFVEILRDGCKLAVPVM